MEWITQQWASWRWLVIIVSVCFILPTLATYGIYLYDKCCEIGSWGILVNAAEGSAPAQTLTWPVVWIYGFFTALYGLGVATRRNDINERGQITERYTQSGNHLGHIDAAVRMAGLYALERLAKEARIDEERRQIIDLIAGFVRTRAPFALTEVGQKKKLGQQVKDYETTARHGLTDVEAAIKILASIAQKEDRKNWQIDLSDMDLRTLHLDGINLAGFDFRGSLLRWLSGTDLSGTDLSYAVLFRAKLLCTNFTGATFHDTDFSHADFFKTNLSNANFFGENNLTQEQLDKCFYTKGQRPPTNLPDGSTIKEEK